MSALLPLLLLLALLLPGVLARTTLRRAELDDAPWVRQLVDSLAWAAALHALAHGLGLLLERGAGMALPPGGVLLALLAPEAAVQTDALDRLAGSGGLAALALHEGLALTLGAALPAGLRRLARRWRWLGRRLRLDAPRAHSLRHSWQRLLGASDFPSDRRPDLVLVSTVVDLAGQPWLHKGVLDEFLLGRDGQLDRLILQQAVRRPLGVEPAAGRAPRFEPIDGDCLVLRGEEISTLQVEYVRLERGADTPAHLPPPEDEAEAFAPTVPI